MIVIGSDHAGFSLKEEIRKHLDNHNLAYIDVGVFDACASDYPAQAALACEKITGGECKLGVLCCGTGIGISMAANKIKGIRAAACSDYFSAKYTRVHNDANVLCLGSRVIGPGLACELVDVFLSSDFEGGRHQKRVDMISALENQ
ncbi:MAG: ribose 5-phosphate isomerase B [Oscillospiraceae bacterium]|jgi:ribose 5-phosphate isomerase B|nr:ribose 5-phosphate isomerase B [Oscillospiraceae bacterium]